MACGKTLHGRADKKFCNDYCRNAYNNQLKSSTSPIVRNINNALLKSPRFLEAVLGTEAMQKVSKEKLLQMVFRQNTVPIPILIKRAISISFAMNMVIFRLRMTDI